MTTAIQTIYIPNIEKQVNAQYIANTFSKNGLAQVRKVYIEPYKYKKYNRAYVEIEAWHETEAAYSFITRLRNPNIEVRLVHVDDDWWIVRINTNLSKFASKNRVLTVFSEPIDDSICDLQLYQDYDIEAEHEDCYEEPLVKVDAVKTQQLRDIISSFREKNEIKNMLLQDNDSVEIESYLREMEWMRNVFHHEVYANM
jgi:hypothetical protein